MFLNHLPVSYWISDIVFLFKFIFTSFLYCALLKDKAIYYLTKVIIQLAIISIPFYVLQLISGPMVYYIGQVINLPPRLSNQEYVNFLIFTYVKGHGFRNSGFSWEPGAYGFFLNMTLLLYLFINSFKFDKKAFCLVIAIITTLSTTSYSALLMVLLLYARARGITFSKLLLFAVPVLIIVAFQLPFLLSKIVVIYNGDLDDMKNIEYLSSFYIQRGEQMPLNRFASLLYLCQLFKLNYCGGYLTYTMKRCQFSRILIFQTESPTIVPGLD